MLDENNSKIQVFSCPQPFNNFRHDYTVFEGSTIEEILQDLNMDILLGDRITAYVFVDDQLIERSQWGSFRPGKGRTVAVNVVPSGGGGGGGKTILRAVALIAVIALAAWAGPLAAGALGIESAVGIGLVTAGVGLVGSLAVNALVPPPDPFQFDAIGGGPVSTSVVNVNNRAMPYGNVPNYVGRMKMYPPLGAQGYSEMVGTEMYHRYLFCIGIGEYDITEPKIGNTILTAFDDYEIAYGGKDDADIQRLYPNDVYEKTKAIELLQSAGWQTDTTQLDTEEITVDLTFPAGIYTIDDDDGHIRHLTVNMEVEYSLMGLGVWTPFPGSPYSLNTAIQHRHGIGFRKDGLAADQYDVRVRKTSEDWPRGPSGADGSTRIGDLYWTALRSFGQNDAVNLANCYFAALRIRITGQLNQTVDTFNCIAQRKLPIYQESLGWSGNVATRNPAWAFAEALRGSANKHPVADAGINGDDLLEWANDCDANGFYCDGDIGLGRTVLDTLQLIAAAGRASRGYLNGQYTVIRDKVQTVEVQHFSPRNSWGYKGQKVFQDLPHALKCEFISEDSDYQVDEQYVYDDGYAETADSIDQAATRFETMNFGLVVDPEHVWKLARYHIAVGRLRPETHEINVDFEHIVCNRGDLVGLTHDVIKVGLGQSRIKSVTSNSAGDIESVEVDDTLTMVLGRTYGARIRRKNGVFVDATIVTDEGDQTNISFSPEIPLASAPEVGDLMFFGETGAIFIQCLVNAIRYHSVTSARLELIAYNSAILDADAGAIPPWNPGITEPIDPALKIPPTPEILDVVLIRWPDIQANINSQIELKASVSFAAGINNGIDPIAYQGQFRTVDEDSPAETGEWEHVPNVSLDQRFINFPVADGMTYDFRIRSVTQYGQTSPWVTYSDYLIVYDSMIPNDLTGLDLVSGGVYWAGMDCAVTWNLPGDDWKIEKIKINIYDDTSAIQLLRTEYVDVDQNFYTYSFVKNLEDNGGTPVSELTFRVWAVSPYGDLSENEDEITIDHILPINPSGVISSSSITGASFAWDAYEVDTDPSFSHFLIRIGKSDGVSAISWGGWVSIGNAHQLRRPITPAEKDDYGIDLTIHIEVKSVNYFGQESSVGSTSQLVTGLNIKPADIDSMEELSILWPDIPIVQGLTVTNSSPSAGYVAWSAFTISFNGVQYSIASGNSNSEYITWKDLSTTLESFDDHPADSADAAASEKIVNGDMELTTNWNDHNTPIVNERSTEQKHGGTYSRKFYGDGRDDGIKSDTYTTVKGQRYQAKVWVYPDDRADVRLAVHSGDGVGFNINRDYGVVENVWNEIVFTFLELEGGSLSDIIIVGSLAAVGGEVYFVDDVSVKEISWNPQEDFIMFVNRLGIHQKAWNAIANQVIASAWIKLASIDDAQIRDLSAEKINVGFLDADRIEANSLTVGKMTFRHPSDITKIDGGQIYVGSTIGINSLTFGNDGIQLDYNSGNPRFYCGNGANEFIKFDGTDLEISTGGTDAVIIKNGGNIRLENGGDLILEADNTNPARLLFQDEDSNARDIEMGRAITNDNLAIFPTISGQCQFRIGMDYSTVLHPFAQVHIYGKDITNVYAYYSSSYYASLLLDADASAQLTCTGPTTSSNIAVAANSILLNAASKQYTFLATGMTVSGHKVLDSGTATNAWADMYADNFTNVADFKFLDDRDDLAAIHKIKGSGIIDKRSGLELIDDDTLPEWLLSKHKKTGKILFAKDGKPYVNLGDAISLLMGAIRQLDQKVEKIKN